MSKHLASPLSRLICFGGARALTNAGIGDDQVEEDPVYYTP